VSRRTFLGAAGAGIGGTSAVLLAACGTGEDASTAVGGSIEEDIDLLNGALELEQSAVVAYARGAKLLSGGALEFAELFAGQEAEHAEALERLIEELGGTPAEERPEEDYADELGLDKLRSADDMLRFAVDLENTAVATYTDAVAKLSSPDARRKAFAIVANEAEHLSVLLGELGEPQVPDAFVTGSQR